MQRFGSYIGGRFVEAAAAPSLPVFDPATEAPNGEVAVAGSATVDAAVRAAREAFPAFAATSRAARLELLGRLAREYERRRADLAAAVSADIGAPVWLAEQLQAATGAAHLQVAADVLATLPFDDAWGRTRVERVPIGVCALITPWNWPFNQIFCKLAPALAVGCTVVLKPSEIAPRSAQVVAEILDATHAPEGVFNMVTGDGSTGALLSAHPDVDLVSFTGSTRAGVQVAIAAAPTVKRVCQELGGKSPNLVLDDAELGDAIPAAVQALCLNTGQSCNAPSRLLVPHRMMEDALAIARDAAERVEVGPPAANAAMGPVASARQWERIQALIAAGMEEGAQLVAGGAGRPVGLSRGFYVRPTIVAGVRNDMRLAREEVFGPVLAVIGYEDEAEAVRLANDTPYGLAAYVQSSDPERAERVAGQLRAGQVLINGAELDFAAPFGGFKQSGNGREWGRHGFHDFLELRAVLGVAAAGAAANGG